MVEIPRMIHNSMKTHCPLSSYFKPVACNFQGPEPFRVFRVFRGKTFLLMTPPANPDLKHLLTYTPHHHRQLETKRTGEE